MPDRFHLALVFHLSHLLWEYIQKAGGFAGPEGRSQFDDRSDPRFLLPDLSYRDPTREPGDDILTPPTLAVEVRSKDRSMRGLRDKCRYYRTHGVEVAWLIDPYARAVEVFEGEADGQHGPRDGALESPALPALPGLRIPVADLWAALGG